MEAAIIDMNYIKKSFFDLQDDPIVLDKIRVFKEMLCRIGEEEALLIEKENAPKRRLALNMKLYKPIVKGNDVNQELSMPEFRAVSYYLKIIFDNPDIASVYFQRQWLEIVFRKYIGEKYVYEIMHAVKEIISYLFPPLKTYIQFSAICYEESDEDVFNNWVANKNVFSLAKPQDFTSKLRAYIAKQSYTSIRDIALNEKVEEFKCFGQVVLKNRLPVIDLKMHKSSFDEFDESVWSSSIMFSKINYNYLCLLLMISQEWQ